MQLGTADTHLLGQHVDIEVAVGEVLVDGFHDTLHQQLVVALDLGSFHLVGLSLGSRVLTLQALTSLQQVLDVQMQLFHIEGFGQEGVSTTFQTFETIADIGHRGEHDDGYVADVDVGLDHPQHGEAVHLGHHDIADDEVVAVLGSRREQFLQSLATVGTEVELVETSQFAGDVVAYLGIVVDNEYAVFGRAIINGFPRCCRLCLRFLNSLYNLLRREVGVAKRQRHREDGAAMTIGAVMGLNSAVMHVDNHLAEVQADARTLDVQALGVASLIETVEDVLQAVLVEPDAVVGDTEHGVLAVVGQTDHHLAVLGGVLERVGQEVGDNLVELATVYPDVKLLQTAVIEAEVEVTVLGAELVHLTDAADKGYQLRLLTMQMHLLLVNLTDIQNLVHKVEDTLRVTLDGVKRCLQLLAIGRCLFCTQGLQLLQRTHDECQRRTDVVGGIDEELHLLLVKTLIGATTIQIAHQPH